MPLRLLLLTLLACGVADGALAKTLTHNNGYGKRMGAGQQSTSMRKFGPTDKTAPPPAPDPAVDSFWPMDTPLPQDALLKPDLKLFVEKRDDIQMAMVTVQMGQRNENPRWMMSQTQLQVFLNKLGQMPDKPLPEDDIWPKLKAPEPGYKGITITLQTEMGKRFAPIKVFEGRITDPNDTLLSPDYGRDLEYWLFGTARVRRDQLLGVAVLPVISFEQCRLLGQKIVQTMPRQCLLPDNNLLLETSEMPTLKSARIRTFDECLHNGTALIYTFPRRCVSAGGRVFTEPPRVYDEFVPADAPLATPTTDAAPDVNDNTSGLKALTPQGAVAPTGVVSTSMPVSGTQALNDAELRAIEPAAGPRKGPNLFQRWIRATWKPEWAEFGK
jgi:hypothetical protein